MYLWNGIRIEVKGSNRYCIIGLEKYLNAVYDHEYEGLCDISVSLIDFEENGVPEINPSAVQLKSILLNMDTDVRMEVYSFESQLWYIYSNHVSVWMDYRASTLVVSVKNMPYAFEYYNILTFILHPLGTLLENFGYYRLRGSCGTINGKSILFTGMDGNGKSISAFAMATHGGSIISDNITFIRKDEDGYRPYSLAKLVKLSLESVNSFFPELNRVHSAAFDSEEIYYFLDDINTFKPDNSGLLKIMLVDKSSTNSSACNPVHLPEILPLLFPTGIHSSIEENAGNKFLFVSDLLEANDICRLTIGTDVNEFVGLIRKTLS